MTLLGFGFVSRGSVIRNCVAFAIWQGVVMTAFARDPDLVLDLWPNGPPEGKTSAGAEQDFTKPTDNLIAGRRIIKLGNVSKPQAHLFFPPKENRNGTAVVICPGGGFNILAWDLEGTEVAEWLNTLGVTGIVLKYRVPTRDHNPVWLAPVQDAQRALSLVRSRASEWELVSDRIGLLGFSAGGQTAAMVSVKQGKRSYPDADDIDAVSCRVDFAAIIYPGGLIDSATGRLREDVTFAKDSPPMFFAHAQDDNALVENSVQAFLALKKAGVPSELHVYDAGGHGYGLRPVPTLPVTTWPFRCADWMQRRGLLTPLKRE